MFQSPVADFTRIFFCSRRVPHQELSKPPLHAFVLLESVVMQFCPACDNKLHMRIGTLQAEGSPDDSSESNAAQSAPKDSVPTIGNAPLTMYCKHCPYSKQMHNSKRPRAGTGHSSSATDERHAFDPCMSRSNYSSNHPLYFSTVVNQYTHMDPTLPCLTVPCQNSACPSNTDATVESAVLYIRYNDQDMEFLYLCKHCRHCWHKNDRGENVMLFDFS